MLTSGAHVESRMTSAPGSSQRAPAGTPGATRLPCASRNSIRVTGRPVRPRPRPGPRVHAAIATSCSGRTAASPLTGHGHKPADGAKGHTGHRWLPPTWRGRPGRMAGGRHQPASAPVPLQRPAKQDDRTRMPRRAGVRPQPTVHRCAMRDTSGQQDLAEAPALCPLCGQVHERCRFGVLHRSRLPEPA